MVTLDAIDRILQLTGLTLEQLTGSSEPEDEGENVVDQRRYASVPDTAELRRILNLPRRNAEPGEELARQFTQALSTGRGQCTGKLLPCPIHLKPIQALALHDLHQHGGLFSPIRVGGGKTLISYLAPLIVQSYRPLLLVPASLKEKTKRDFQHLALHFKGPSPSAYRIESYELLGRPQAGVQMGQGGEVLAPGLLERYAPDLIVMDEVHKVKNHKAAVTKRVIRYMREHPHTVVCGMSGTITKRSLRDFAHIIAWALPRTCPVPLKWTDLEAWADCLDEKVNPFKRVRPGALVHFCTPEETKALAYGGEDELAAVRQAFRRRLVETPGVVATTEGPMDMSLSIAGVNAQKEDPKIEGHFQTLRNLWETPDEHPISDPLEFRRAARELALGFFYRWNPRPPVEWLQPRKEWSQFCRHILKHNRRGLDSEGQVVQAVDRGWFPGEVLARWRAVKDSFEPNTEAVWFSDEAIQGAVKWADDVGGIIWVEHVEFGKRLAKETGLPYYQRKGLDENGRYIEDHPPAQRTCIASIASNKTGCNLQGLWSTNLVMASPANNLDWEQLLGRTHRPGQSADEVKCDVWLGCIEYVEGYAQARKDALFVQDSQGQAQKLLYAADSFPEPFDIPAVGYRWSK